MLRTILGRGFATENASFAAALFVGGDFRGAVEKALDATGSRERRQRLLPASVILVLVLAMSLFRHLSIPGVYRQVFFWTRRGRRAAPHVTDEALVHAKARLGVDAVAALFHDLSAGVVVEPTFHGMRVFAIDGVRLCMFDTKANEKRFGKISSSHGDQAAFPQLLAVALIATETRHAVRVSFNPCTASERECAGGFLGDLERDDLVILDRGFHAVWLFERFLERSIHFVCRASASYKPRILERLGRGDYLVELTARVQRPDKTWKRVRLILRMIEYRIGRRRRVRLVTDLLDQTVYKPLQLARLYRERWECELAYDEIKTHLAAPARGTVHLPFRSKTPDGVLQEAYALFTMYNLLRSWIAVSVSASKARPRDISFVGVLQLIRVVFAELQGIDGLPLPIVRAIAALRQRKPRRPRWYHRVVRVKINRFPRKRRWHHQHIIDYASQVRLVNHRRARKPKA